MVIQSYSTGEIRQAITVLTSLLDKCIKVEIKLLKGSSQHTLLVNRIKALRIAIDTLKSEF